MHDWYTDMYFIIVRLHIHSVHGISAGDISQASWPKTHTNKLKQTKSRFSDWTKSFENITNRWITTHTQGRGNRMVHSKSDGWRRCAAERDGIVPRDYQNKTKDWRRLKKSHDHSPPHVLSWPRKQPLRTGRPFWAPCFLHIRAGRPGQSTGTTLRTSAAEEARTAVWEVV
jgi:hypothetical protein